MTPDEIRDWEPFLKRIPLFVGLTTEDVARIAARMLPLSLPKGATLFSQGDQPDALYIVTSGQVRVVRDVKGVETVDAFLGRGETLGEGGILTGEPRTTTVRLATTCEFLKLPRKEFEEVLRETPSIMLHLSRVLTKRIVQTSRRLGQRREDTVAQVFTLACALPRPDRVLLSAQLAVQLVEQTRRRVLLVDMTPDAGALARALGVKPEVVTEASLREINLRDPGKIRTLTQQHPSGLEILTIPAATLGGRLYSGIYLFLNFLRDVHDVVLVCTGAEFGDVERSVISESDKALLVGCDDMRPQFRQLEAELASLVEPKRLVRMWTGEPDLEEVSFGFSAPPTVLAWDGDLGERFERSGNPYEALEGRPKTERAIERLARRLCDLKVGIALGTGAALGHSLIGILKVFKRERIPLDVIAGTSMGSLVGGLTALGLEPEEIEDLALRIDKGWVYENLFWDLTLPRSGMFAGQTLLRFIRSYFGSKDFGDLEVPYACVAADIQTGEEVVLREGRVADAIRASCGLPLIFQPIRINGRYLVDGGLVNPVPTSVLADMGADTLVAVNLTMPASDRPGSSGRKDRMPMPIAPVDLASLKELALPELLKAPNMFDVFFQMIYTMEYEIAQSRASLAHVVIHPDLKGFSWTEMHRAKELIRAGQLVAEQYIPQIKALIPYFADRCSIARGSNRLA